MRTARFAAALALCLTFFFPTLVVGRSEPSPSFEAADASHIGGALLLCGQVIDYTAPDGVAVDGAMTMIGVSDPGPHAFTIAATATLTPADSGLLAAIATTDSFTCLDAVGDGMGVIVELAILPTAQFCGSVDPAGSTWRLSDVDFPDLTTTLTAEAEAIVDADVRLDDLLLWFDMFGNEACLAFTTDAGGVVVEITLDGDLLVCGDVADTSATTTSAVVEYAGDEAIRPDIVGLGGIVLPASLFTDAAIGLMELGYAAQNHPGYDGFADICALVPVATTELLPASMATSVVGICGWYGIGAATIGLTDQPQPSWNWFAVLFNGLSGLVAVPGSDANLEAAMSIGDPACLVATVDGGPKDEAIEVAASVDDCIEVVARTAETITMHVGETTGVFVLTPGSSVDALLATGTTSEISLDAFGGEGGAVVIQQTRATCDGAGGGGELPDTALTQPSTITAGLVGLAAIAVAAAGALVGRRRRS